LEKSNSRYAKSRDARNRKDACNTRNASNRCEPRKDRKTSIRRDVNRSRESTCKAKKTIATAAGPTAAQERDGQQGMSTTAGLPKSGGNGMLITVRTHATAGMPTIAGEIASAA
jgi:hypothetical protein